MQLHTQKQLLLRETPATTPATRKLRTQSSCLFARRSRRRVAPADHNNEETMPRPLKVSKMQLWHGLWMLVPGAAVYAYMKPSQNEEELAAQLRANYARNVRDAKAKRNDMQRYFDAMKSGDAAQAKTMAGTLQGGKASVVKPTYDERFRKRE